MADGALGWKIANLVVVQDNEKGFEFRVQLEIPLADTAIGVKLGSLLATGKSTALTAAKNIALANVNALATAGFRKIVRMAFDENIKHVKARESAARKPKKKVSGKKNAVR